MTYRTPTRRLSAAAAALTLALALSACSTGSSIEGTYFGTAGDTALVLGPDGTCGYTDDYDEDDGVQIGVEDDCSWSRSGTTITFTYKTDEANSSLRKTRTVTGAVGDDGALSFPDQDHWNGEIYTKE